MSDYLNCVKTIIDISEWSNVEKLSLQIEDLIYNKNRKIITLGNGGSGSTASHFAGDFSKTFGIEVVCLNDNNTALTAWANDDKYDNVFLDLAQNYFEPEDIVIAFTGSGNSKNIYNALEYLSKVSTYDNVWCVTGYTGGDIMTDFKDKISFVHFPVVNMEIYEDLSLVMSHAIKSNIIQKTKKE